MAALGRGCGGARQVSNIYSEAPRIWVFRPISEDSEKEGTKLCRFHFSRSKGQLSHLIDSRWTSTPFKCESGGSGSAAIANKCAEICYVRICSCINDKGDKVQRSQEAAVHVVRGCLACSHLPALTQDSLMCSLPRSELHRPCCLAARHHSLPLLTVSSRKNEKAMCVVAFLAESECKPLSRRCASLSSLPGAAALGASPGEHLGFKIIQR
ncbi:hypothetical protein O3P69_011599 [Scylla paramamosain]|uniref:Uncharacterized protein n=1 Tax=Scylla paramamosain TaxID=85552 RepID=A0AAW0T728_SCYPA